MCSLVCVKLEFEVCERGSLNHQLYELFETSWTVILVSLSSWIVQSEDWSGCSSLLQGISLDFLHCQ